MANDHAIVIRMVLWVVAHHADTPRLIVHARQLQRLVRLGNSIRAGFNLSLLIPVNSQYFSAVDDHRVVLAVLLLRILLYLHHGRIFHELRCSVLGTVLGPIVIVLELLLEVEAVLGALVLVHRTAALAILLAAQLGRLVSDLLETS